jgi:glucose-6-phosphate isomerase
MSKPYTQDLAGCFGNHGLSDALYQALLSDTAGALQAIRAAHADGSLPLLRLPGARDDMAAFRPVADRFRADFSDVVVLGTGGSSLGGQTLYSLIDRGFGPPGGTPRLHFMDNVDPDTFDALLGALDLDRTGVIAISKSGTTAETLAQLAVLIDAMRRAVGEDAIGEQVVAITEPKDSVLSRLSDRFGMTRLDHDPHVGGRFSVLSVVGLLPAMIAGLDAAAVREGAASVLDPLLAGAEPADIPPACGAAVSVGLAREKEIATTVLMPYCDRLANFGLWYCQLWAESLGKEGNGTTPVRAVGTVDQHSQLQLYLDGPADKMFTLVLTDCAGDGKGIPADFADMEGLSYFRGRTMGDLLDAEGRATAETLLRNRRPTRFLNVPTVDETALGALMMHYMLETMIAARLLDVDAFDQPAVEEGKVLTREYMAKGSG